MNIKKYLKEVYSTYVKSELTDTLMGKTDVSYKCRELYDEALITKTISVFKLDEVLPEIPKRCKAINIEAPSNKLSKLLHNIVMTTEEKPDCIYLHWELPSVIPLERTAQMFDDFEDVCSKIWHDTNKKNQCNLIYTSRYAMIKRAKVLMLMYFN